MTLNSGKGWVSPRSERIGFLSVSEDSEPSEASARYGESLSVRVAFHWDPAKKPLDLGDMGFWEVLEVEPFENIYPGQTSEWLAQERKKTNNSETDWPL